MRIPARVCTMIRETYRISPMCEPMTLMALATVATAGMSVMQTMNASKKQSPSDLAKPPTPQEVKEADIKGMKTGNEASKVGVNAGTASTLLTGPEGVKDPLDLGKNKLLGQ